MTLNHLNKRIKGIDTNYPLSLHPYVVLFIPIAFSVILLIIVPFIYCILHLKSYIYGFIPMTKVFFLATKFQTLVTTLPHGMHG